MVSPFPIRSDLATKNAVGHQTRPPLAIGSHIGKKQIDRAGSEFRRPGHGPTDAVFGSTRRNRGNGLTDRERTLDHLEYFQIGGRRQIAGSLDHRTRTRPRQKHRLAVDRELPGIISRNDGGRPGDRNSHQRQNDDNGYETFSHKHQYRFSTVYGQVSVSRRRHTIRLF